MRWKSSAESASRSRIEAKRVVPALLTRPSIRPHRSRAAAASRRQSASSATSARITSASPPTEMQACATRSAGAASLLKLMATPAPCRVRARAVAAPTPLEDPVTMKACRSLMARQCTASGLFDQGPNGYGFHSALRLRENEPFTGPLTEPDKLSPSASPSNTPSVGDSKWTLLPLTQTLSSGTELWAVLKRPSQTLLESASSTDTDSRDPLRSTYPSQRPSRALSPRARGVAPAQAASRATNPIDIAILMANSLRRHAEHVTRARF